MKNNNAIRTIERMNNIINEMKELRDEFESILNQINNEKELLVNDDCEDLDSYENIPEEDLKDLINEEYNEDEDPEYLAWVEANFGEDNENDDNDDDDEEIEEPEIYNIYFSIENFETLMDYLGEIPFGYVFDSTENEYLVRMDEDMVDEIKELLEKWAYIEKYERLCSPAYYRIVAVQNAIYYSTHYNL